MNTVTPVNPIWEALGAEADGIPVRRPDFSKARATQPRASLSTKLTRAWLSGYVPLLLLFAWFSKGYLVVAAPVLAWIVLPLVAGRHGLTPSRLLAMVLPAILVPPAYLFYIRFFDSLDPRAPMRRSYLSYSYDEVALGLGLVAVMSLLTFLIRRRSPWFEQTSRPRLRWLGAVAFLAFPLFILSVMFWKRLDDESIRRWERDVAAQDPGLRQLRLVHYGLEPWRRLENRSSEPLELWSRSVDILKPRQVAMLRDFEAEALRLFSRRAPLDSAGHDSAERVLGGLLRYHYHLRHPLQVLARLETLRMQVGTPRVSHEAFQQHCESTLSSGATSLETLKAELAIIERLIADCPSSIAENDRRWYVQRKRWLRVDGSNRTLLDIDRLYHECADVQNIVSWLRVRPHLERGATLRQLRDSSDRDVGWAAHRLLYREADVTHEVGCKPLWEFFALAYRVKIYQLENGSFPESLQQLGLDGEHLQGYEWVKRGSGGVLKRRAEVGPKCEWVFS